MEPIIKETQVIRDHDGGWDNNTRTKSNWALGLGIAGTVLGGAALAKQGGNYGQREQPWMHGSPGFQEQNWNGGGNYPNIDPRYFM